MDRAYPGSMEKLIVNPWILPPEPDLARLAMDVADAMKVKALKAWPRADRGGIGFGGLPPFLSWHGLRNGNHHLVLLQPREVGALVPGAATAPLPFRWLENLDLEGLARPLAHHPAFEGGAMVHVVHLVGRGEAQVRSYGEPAPDILREVLARLSDVQEWRFTECRRTADERG